MADRKILPFSTFTICLTLLLLSSRIYCHVDVYEEDCEDYSSEDSSETGNVLPGKGPGSNPGKGPGSDPGKEPGSDPLKELDSLPIIGDITDTLEGILDPTFFKSLFDYAGDLAGMLTPILTAIKDALGTIFEDPESFLSDPTPVLTKLLKGILGPIAGVVQDVAIEIPSEGNAIEAQLFDALPEQLGFLQDPINTILNLVYGIGLDAADATQGAADLDGEAVLKSVGEIGDNLKTLISGLANLPS